MGTQRRLVFKKKNDVPGPGSYEFKPKMIEGAQYTMRPKTAEPKDKCQTPGSGTYNPKIYAQYRQPQQWSMGTKSQLLNTSKLSIPGPGTYENKSSVINRPTYVFSKDTNRNFYSPSKVPGPGTYKQGASPDSPALPQWRFGTESQRKTFNAQKTHIPGPGSYENKNSMDQYYSSHSVGVTLISRKIPGNRVNVPGAGTYQPNFYDKKSNPRYKIGTEKREQSNIFAINNIPGVGQYNLSLHAVYENMHQNDGQHFSFKGGQNQQREENQMGRPMTAKKREVFEEYGRQVPKWGFGTHVEQAQNTNIFAPGPGAFNKLEQ